MRIDTQHLSTGGFLRQWHRPLAQNDILRKDMVFRQGDGSALPSADRNPFFQQAVPPLFGGGFLLTVGGISPCGMGGEKRLRKPVYLLRNETMQQKQRANTQKIDEDLDNI